MQYVSVGAFRAHLLQGANYTSPIKQFYIRGITCWTEKCPKRSLVVNWLSILFFKVVIFVLVVTASAVPFLYNYAITSQGRSRGQSLPTAQHPC